MTAADWGPSFHVFRGATAHTQIAASTQNSCRTQSAAISTIDRYVGALRSRITNSLDLPPDMSFAVTKLKDKLVVVIRVAQSKHRIAIGEEGILYVRKSGTNKKLAPNDWPPKEQDRPYGI